MSAPLAKLIEVARGGIVEAVHMGSIVAVEPEGAILASVGDEQGIVTTRSTIKPIQAIPLVTSGAADRFGITSKELAVICGSHHGQTFHTETVAAILARAGLGPEHLLCGKQRPTNQEAAREIEKEGGEFTALHNNCSGKHSGMLATGVHLGPTTEDYTSPDHEVQRRILDVFRRLGGLDSNIPTAVDGCSAPTFGVPLYSLALAFARLANPWNGHHRRLQERESGQPGPDLGSDEIVAIKWIVAAMTSYPEMVGGSTGSLDTDLMRVTKGRVLSKVGAEAVQALAVLPGERWPRGLGIAIKIQDGATRALLPAVVETLIQLDAIDHHESMELSTYHSASIFNRRGIKVGDIRPVFAVHRRQLDGKELA